ncbi:MAG: hemolysin III family protein [Bacteroidia bacterium]|nr:hemolysin III family protein [Bacteroidia bacterium]
MKTARNQSIEEEELNFISHAIGFIGALMGSIYLLRSKTTLGYNVEFISYLIYSFGLSALYLASSLYHHSKDLKRKSQLNILDHSAIYLLIAGTYTPVTLITIAGIWGKAIFITVWTAAIAGIILKQFYTGRFPKLSTLIYVLMGWIILIAFKPLTDHMNPVGVTWLVSGGVLYTLGALLYQKKEMKYNHVIFHLFVMMGSICHYIMILNYIN